MLKAVLHYRLFTICLCLALLFAAGCREPEQAKRQRTAGEAIRIDCIERGIHKISGEDLAHLGIDLKSIDVRTMALVHYRTAVPFYGEGLADGRFDPQDILYFFSDGSYQDTVPYVNIEKDFAPRTQRFMLYLGPSEFHPLYFKSVRAGGPAAPDPQRYPVSTVSGRVHFEQDPIFRFVDTSDSSNLTTSTADSENVGTDFIFWAQMTYPPTDKTASLAAVAFDLPQADLTREMTLKSRLFAATDNAIGDIEHHVAVALNGKPVGQISWSKGRLNETELKIPAGVCQATNRLEYNLLEPKGLDQTLGQERAKVDYVMLDSFDVVFKQPTRACIDALEINSVDDADQKAMGRFTVDGFSTDAIRVFDLGARETLSVRPYKQNGTFGFNLERQGRQGTLLALTEAGLNTPALKRVKTRALFTQPSDCELLILTHPAFTKALEPLVAWKRSRGLKTEVVEITDIFNEQTGGYAEPGAMRQFIEHVYKSQPQPKLRYVLLVGDSVSLAKYQSFCPAFAYLQCGHHANENYFASFDAPAGNPQVAVGRFSTNDPQQVSNAVAKVIACEGGKMTGVWQTRFLTVAAAAAWADADAQDLIKQYVQPNYISSHMATNFGIRDNSYEDVLNQELMQRFNEGSLITVFFGHGGGTVWEIGPTRMAGAFQRHLFDQDSVGKLENKDRLPVVCAMTCYTNDFDNPTVRQTLGETFVNAPGGALAVIGSAGRSNTGNNVELIKLIFKAMREHHGTRLGDYFRSALVDLDSPFSNKNFLILGDPSLEFAFPQRDIHLNLLKCDQAAGKITFQYELPPEVELPSQLACTLLNHDNQVIDEWKIDVPQRQGESTPTLTSDKLEGEMRILVYARGKGQCGHTAMLPLFFAEPAKKKP